MFKNYVRVNESYENKRIMFKNQVKVNESFLRIAWK